MHRLVKKSAKKTLHVTKKIVARNKYTKKLAQKAKRAVLLAITPQEHRELYNLTSFYPTIHEYYDQTHDFDDKKDPLISILLPTYNTPETYLRECIESIIIQSYPKWELCIADDNSADKNVVSIIKEYQEKDSRIKLVERKVNGHISEASNSALALASGTFVSLMDHDDVLWPNALYEIVKVVRANRDVDFIYSDEDKIDGTGKVHSYPFLKPDFSPEFLESCNYITHFSCIRTSAMKEVDGFRKGYEGAQDWDLFVRITEITSKVIHIPKILYSWRIHEASTASNTDAKPYVYEAQRKLLVDHVTRIGRKGIVETGIITQHRTIKYDVKESERLAVFIGHHSVTDTVRLLKSIVTVSSGTELELFIVADTTISEASRKVFEDSAPGVTQKIVSAHTNLEVWNVAVKEATGKYLLFIEDGAEIISKDWAKIIIGDCQSAAVGVVGPVLLSPDTHTVLSAGIGIGYGEDGYADMLQGMPFDDPHYSRGLYVKSRRNVSAFNPAAYALAKNHLAALAIKMPPGDSIELAQALSKQRLRHVYTPYLQIAYHKALPKIKVAANGVLPEDPYLNPNFDHANQRMEVRP